MIALILTRLQLQESIQIIYLKYHFQFKVHQEHKLHQNQNNILHTININKEKKERKKK